MDDLKSKCDRFNVCSANICPLDADWQQRTHLNGERVCFYLTEAYKDNAEANFRSAGKCGLYELIVGVTPAVITTFNTIKSALERAKGTGSRIAKALESVRNESQHAT